MQISQRKKEFYDQIHDGELDEEIVKIQRKRKSEQTRT